MRAQAMTRPHLPRQDVASKRSTLPSTRVIRLGFEPSKNPRLMVRETDEGSEKTVPQTLPETSAVVDAAPERYRFLPPKFRRRLPVTLDEHDRETAAQGFST